jgi:predicted CxxxxCH...CXXCH cytochrome family protein
MSPPGEPPRTDTSDVRVGAHESHLTQGDLRHALECADCHIKPMTVDQPGHVDPLPAEITWGALATTAGLDPAWDRTTRTCTNTYCHGAILGGGSNKAPEWTVVDGSQAACGTCHGNPPPPPHPAATDCQRCHVATVTAAGEIDVAGGHHIDGTLDVGSECWSCHGDEATQNPAPPIGVMGETATTEIAVGAHQSHVQTGDLRQAMDCVECHVKPATVTQAGHIDPSPAELTWGDLAMTGGLSPAWDRPAAQCSNTWCHGTALAGGTNKSPVWTTVDGTQSACGTCHGAPPPPPHPTLTTCRNCHPETVTSAGTIDVAGGFHVNGALDVERTHPADWALPANHGAAAKQGLSACTGCHGGDLTGGAVAGVSCDTCHSGWKTNCTFCHGGTDNTTGAPPVDTLDRTATTERTVGAHTSHLEGPSLLSNPVACATCHVVPGDALSAGHVDGASAEVLGAAGWTSTAETCSNYCHGAFPGGNAGNTPQWTLVSAGEAACGTCHAIPPATGRHATHVTTLGFGCEACHSGVANSAGTAIVTPSLHVNGSVTVVPVGGTYVDSTNSCSPAPACHGTRTW